LRSDNALLRCRDFARPHARGLAFSLLVGFGMMGAGLAIPPIVGAVIDALRAGERRTVVVLGLAVVGVGLAEAGLAYVRRTTAARASIGMERDMRDAIYARLQRLPVSFHDGWQSGQLLSRAMGDLSTIRRFIGFGLVFLVINVVQFGAALYLMIRLNAPLAVFTAAIAIPVVLFTRRFDLRYHDISRKVQDNEGDLTTIIEESTTGIRIIKAFGRAAFVTHRFGKQTDVVHDSSMEAVRLTASFWTLLHLLPNLNLMAVLGFGGWAVSTGRMSVGGLAAFVGYLNQLTWPIRSVGWILAGAEQARTAAERVFEVLDTQPSVSERPRAVKIDAAAGHIRFENVAFAYPGSLARVLDGLDLEVRPGETLAIVGLTGCGKTTVASLVPRLHDVSGGRVLLDGTDVRDATLHSLRGQIGMAFEEPILFSMSARENLLLGRARATDDDIRRALETADATFVYDLPWGLDTRIGEQGHSLSGGQRQRLALARAIIGNPRVLVLDDPLSAVDVHTEAQIEAALARVLSGTTALLSAHRPSTLALADRVALLDGGTIVATGTHTELLESVPLYRDVLSHDAREDAR